jgi:ligand-binding SRPBCC domain-containing protein
MVRSFSFTSDLDAPADVLWAHATTIRGVNREFVPFLRMTAPPGADAIDQTTVKLGERLFRSWILLFGFLPVDYDDLTIVELEPGRRFLERSPMLTQRLWTHERIVEPRGEGGCSLTDRIGFEPKIAALGGAQLPMFRTIFAYRHHRLVRLFGGRTRPADQPRA